MINTILFDLDGTLLPMDDQAFMKVYFEQLATLGEHFGVEGRTFVKMIWGSTEQMLVNDGTQSNETCFWNAMEHYLGKDIREAEPLFEEFYRTKFLQVKQTTAPTMLANECVQLLKAKGYTLAIATNPLFPRIATQTRMAWAGLQLDDFALVTTYENASFCKPNLSYYQEILDQLGVTPQQCMMVGNDVAEDMCVRELGMDTYLVTDCLINKKEYPLSSFKQSTLAELKEWLQTLPEAAVHG